MFAVDVDINTVAEPGNGADTEVGAEVKLDNAEDGAAGTDAGQDEDGSNWRRSTSDMGRCSSLSFPRSRSCAKTRTPNGVTESLTRCSLSLCPSPSRSWSISSGACGNAPRL